MDLIVKERDDMEMEIKRITQKLQFVDQTNQTLKEILASLKKQ